MYCEFLNRCAVYDSKLELPGMVGENSICSACIARGRRDVRMLRYDFVDLTQLLVPRDGRGDEGIFRPKPESSLPLDLGVLSLRDDLVQVVGTVERRLRSANRCALPRYHQAARDGYRLDQGVEYVSEHVPLLASLTDTVIEYDPPYGATTSQYDGLGTLTLFRRLHRRVSLISGLVERVRTMPGDCPQCAATALRRVDDSDVVWCASCSLRMTPAAYLEHVRLQA